MKIKQINIAKEDKMTLFFLKIVQKKVKDAKIVCHSIVFGKVFF